MFICIDSMQQRWQQLMNIIFSTMNDLFLLIYIKTTQQQQQQQPQNNINHVDKYEHSNNHSNLVSIHRVWWALEVFFNFLFFFGFLFYVFSFVCISTVKINVGLKCKIFIFFVVAMKRSFIAVFFFSCSFLLGVFIV